MKRVGLFLILFLLTGCYDYNELTDLSVVSSMFIDYKDSEYVVNLEILNTSKNEEPSYFLEGSGKTFELALNDAYNKSSKHIYLSHLNIVVVSNSIAKYKMDNLYDYFLRDADARKDSYFLMCDNNNFKKFVADNKKSIGESIKDTVEYNIKENGTFATSKFSQILNSYLNKKTYVLGSIDLTDGEVLLKDVYLVTDDKLDTKLDRGCILLYNLIYSLTPVSFVFEYDNNIYEVYRYKLDKKIDYEKIDIDIKCEIRFLSVDGIHSADSKDIVNLSSNLNEHLKNYFQSMIDYSKKIDSDIYNFDNLYYKYEPELYTDGIWKNLNYQVEVKTSINEKGLILGTLEDVINE